MITRSIILSAICSLHPASKEGDGQTAWKSTLRFDRLYREMDPDTGKVSYRLEEIPEEQGGEHQLISLIVGSHGKKAKEEWIKILGPNYSLESMDWHDNYQRIRDALNVGDQGYVTHEAAEWHPYRNCWLFFPRKISGTPFNKAVWLSRYQ